MTVFGILDISGFRNNLWVRLLHDLRGVYGMSFSYFKHLNYDNNQVTLSIICKI